MGTPAVTTRGFKEPECQKIAHWICDVLERPEDAALKKEIAKAVTDLCHEFPVY